jgi:nitrite reductase/ring-hydroxylating ferredoxin subunit
MNDEFTRVAKVGQVREGDFHSVNLPDGTEILLIKAQGQIFAVDIMCTHQSTWLDSGMVHPDTLEVECPLHEGKFDLRSGAVTHEPPEEPLQTYAVRIEGDDVLVGPPK